MSAQPFDSELARALARPDVDELRKILAEFFLWHDDGCPAVSDHVIDPWIYDTSDKERSMAFVALAMADYDSTDFLGLISAGVLEDIFFASASVSEDILCRVEQEATRNARFKWMLSGMYTTSFRPDYKLRIEQACKGTSPKDPLPPRPTA